MSARIYIFPPVGPLGQLSGRIRHHREMALATGSPLHWQLVRALEAKRAAIAGTPAPRLTFGGQS